MSREIKFRLRKDGQIVGYEMWFEGNDLAKPCWIYAYPDGLFNLHNPYIEHDSKDEFTGLHDKNANEIYEGDIVDFMSDQSDIRNHKVTWHLSGWRLDDGIHTPTNLDFYNWHTYEHCQVIGNIYENPELLTQTKKTV